MAEISIQPLNDRVVVKIDGPNTEEATASGILVARDEKPKPAQGIVAAVGPGRYEHGSRIPLGVEIGDWIMFEPPYGGSPIEIGGEYYYILAESHIVARQAK